MAGRRSVGELVAIISADAEQFNKTLSDSEKRLTAFAKQATSPVKFVNELAGGITSAVSGPIAAALKPISELVEMLPGLHAYGALLNPRGAAQKMEEVTQHTLENAREAMRVGFDPQFLAALRTAAGSDADAVENSLGRLMISLGQLKAGVGDAKENISAETKFKRWGIDPDEMFGANAEERLGLLKKRYQELGREQGTAMLADVGGRKSAIGTATFFEHEAAGLEHYLELIKEHNLHAPRMIAYARELHNMDRELKLHTEAAEAAGYQGIGALFGLGAKQFRAGHIREGLRNLLGGSFNLTNAGIRNLSIPGWLGLFPESQYRSEELTGAERRATLAGMSDEERQKKEKGGKSFAEIFAELEAKKPEDALKDMNAALDEQSTLLRYTEEGWKGLEKEMLAVDRAVTASGGKLGEQGAMLRERLGVERDRRAAVEEAKARESLEKQIESRLLGGGQGIDPFAQAALAGSQGAYQSFARGLPGADVQTDIGSRLDQIVESLKKPALTPELQQRIRDAAIELQKLNGKLNPGGPVPPAGPGFKELPFNF